MATLLPSKDTNDLRSWLTRYWGWILFAAIILIAAPLFTPGAIYFWSYRGFRSLFHDHLGMGTNLAMVLGLTCAIAYAIAMPYAVQWLITGRRRIRSYIAVLIVFGSTPLLHVLLDSNFNQANGDAQKWYAWRPGDQIILSDNGGYDPATGVERHRLTTQIANIMERQKRGLRPRRVSGDPRQLTFFEPTTGRPLIWYSKASDGSVTLFDAEGFDPETGHLLSPITNEVAAAVRQSADEQDARASVAATARAAQAEREAQEKTRQALVSLFDVDRYALGMVLVGVKPQRLNDAVSEEAARTLVADMTARLQAEGIASNELGSSVYSSVYYDALMQGNDHVLKVVGLIPKLRAAVFAVVGAACRNASSVSGVISCKLNADVRILAGSRHNASYGHWSETGAAISRDEAIANAARILIERHPQITGLQ